MRTRYWIKTWDSDKQEFTPQKGVSCGPYTLFGLRKAVRKLQGMGYDCCRTTPSVLVYRTGPRNPIYGER